MRTPTPRRTVTLCATVTTLALAGCTTDAADTGPTPTPTDSWSKQWSPEDEAAAVQEAEQAVRDYFSVRDQCLADPPNTDPSCFDAVAVDQQLLNDYAALEYSLDQGSHHVGGVKVVGTERVVDVQLLPGSKDVTLSVCFDGTDLDVLGPDGTSVKEGGSLRGRMLFVVRKHADKWQVAYVDDDPEGEACG